MELSFGFLDFVRSENFLTNYFRPKKSINSKIQYNNPIRGHSIAIYVLILTAARKIVDFLHTWIICSSFSVQCVHTIFMLLNDWLGCMQIKWNAIPYQFLLNKKLTHSFFSYRLYYYFFILLSNFFVFFSIHLLLSLLPPLAVTFTANVMSTCYYRE